MIRRLLPTLVAPGLLFAIAAPATAQPAILLRADEVHVGNGEVLRPGAVLVEDGRIAAVTEGPGDAEDVLVVDAGGVLTPGLIDAACQLGTHRAMGFAEQSSELIPQLHVADAIDVFSKDFERLQRGGVTTVYVTPESSSVLGSRGAVLKTGGPDADRWLAVPPSIKANLGPESFRRGSVNRTPSRFRDPTLQTRRGTTRMGSTWVFRKAFFDAMRQGEEGASDLDPAVARALQDVLQGSVRLRFQARQAHDIYTADRLCSEFGLSFVLEYGLEAYRCLDLLASKQIPVIYGPISDVPRGLTAAAGDAGRPCLTTPAQLRERGIPFCLTACDGSGETGLARQAGLAVRYGLDGSDALRAVTEWPAQILGAQARVGLLASGLDADLVVWSGPVHEATSRPRLVIIGGEVVHDPEGLAVPPANQTPEEL